MGNRRGVMLSRLFGFLVWNNEIGGVGGTGGGVEAVAPGEIALKKFIGELSRMITNVMGPIFGIIGTIGIFFAIYLAWRLASAEDDGKRKEAKKQLMWTVIAVIALFAFIALFAILADVLQESIKQ